MGQTTSTSGPDGSPGSEFVAEQVHKEEIIELFHKDTKRLVRSVEATAMASKVNTTSLNEKNILTPSDLAYLFQLSAKKDDDISVSSPELSNVVHYIYDTCRVVSTYPFIYATPSSPLTLDDLVVCSAFHSGRYKRLVGNEFPFTKLLFVSLSYKALESHVRIELSEQTEQRQLEHLGPPEQQAVPLSAIKSINNEKVADPSKRKSVYTLIRKKRPDTAGPVAWSKLPVVKELDGIDIDNLKVSAADIHKLVTLFLLLACIPQSSRSKMQETLNFLVRERWAQFEEFALALLKHLDVSLALATKEFTYGELFADEFPQLGNFIKEGFASLFKTGLLSAHFEDEDMGPVPQELTESTKQSSLKFEESKLVSYPTIATIAYVLKTIGSPITVTKENLIRLYIGRDAGFSIRSVESKIFKWQAPTLFVVSGKRLRNKTATTNRRYTQFDSEYPRYFRASENHLRPWQHDNDRVTYAVLVTQPWQLSNKNNFGNKDTVIMSLQPYVDYYQSSNASLGSHQIYFNTLGSGIGFGNNQPINKNGIKKYLPGDVSLTVEPNLEFAVFRHILSSKSNTYFQTSHHRDIAGTDFEDRFIITDLEVWGVGSTKELEHQKKQWEWEQKQAEARQNVNLRNMGEDRAFMEMVGLVGNHGAGGSV